MDDSSHRTKFFDEGRQYLGDGLSIRDITSVIQSPVTRFLNISNGLIDFKRSHFLTPCLFPFNHGYLARITVGNHFLSESHFPRLK